MLVLYARRAFVASEIDVLLSRVEDASLRADLTQQVQQLRLKRSFGLVFEGHAPEFVKLPSHPVRRGSQVTLRDGGDGQVWGVRKLTKKQATLVDADGQLTTVPAVDLVVIAEFGDAIYPGFKRLGAIEHGGDKPSQVVIKGENHHVLEALQFTHAGRVDCIYIDPPYNTGAKDWKYNNRYVDETDAYRHSKWLAFMERRLKLAKELLNPDDSVLIVTIDEKEYLRLGLLLEQTFLGSKVQMVSTLINPATVPRAGAFARSDEYIFFVSLGTAAPQRVRLNREWVSGKGRTHTGNIRWDLLRRSGEGAARKDSPGCFYPIYVNPDGPTISEFGDALPAGTSVVDEKERCVAVLPIRKDGSEGRWQWSPATIRLRRAQGRVRVSGSEERGFVISVLKDGEFGKITKGEFVVKKRNPDGSVVVGDIGTDTVLAVPGSQWRIASHDATQYGSRLLSDALLPGRKFPFPKSLYAVEDTIRFFVKDKPNALVLDFFGGSGTTTHAVARLNHQDGGSRRSIVVTNNEVSESEAKALRAKKHQPGDPEWEALGIFEYITRPRVTAAVTGQTHSGKPVDGDYKFTDEFAMADGFAENVEFLELAYLDPLAVELDLAFEAIAPMLWLRAGGVGPVIDHRADESGADRTHACTDSYGVLFDTDGWSALVAELPDSARTVFIVTDSQSVFAQVSSELPTGVETVRLYENYLTTFTINQR